MRTLTTGLVLTIASLLFCSQALSGEIISDPEKLAQIFTNKTAKGTHLKKDFSYDVFFAADGKVERVTEDGDKHSGTWRISDDGKHCVHFSNKSSENCQIIKAGNRDDVYFRMKQKGDRQIKLMRLKNFRDGNELPKE